MKRGGSIVARTKTEHLGFLVDNNSLAASRAKINAQEPGIGIAGEELFAKSSSPAPLFKNS
jgi:hypothetical protein